MNDITYHIATMKLETGLVNGKPACLYAVAPSDHVIRREVSLIENSPEPLEAWTAQLDVIHECTYADAWN